MRRNRVILGLLSMTLVAAMVGCEPAVFPSNTPRSQYQRQQVLRGDERNAKKETVWGDNEANVRDRLKPLDSQ